MELDLSDATIRELLAKYASIMEELRTRKIVRSGNNPVADYCESLVVRALHLDPMERSNKGCDAVDPRTNKHYEIKGRRITRHNPSTQLSVIRDLQGCHFDFLVGVLFDENFTVTHAHCIPLDVVREAADHREYVNGWILHLKPSLWARAGVRDITSLVKNAQLSWN